MSDDIKSATITDKELALRIELKAKQLANGSPEITLLSGETVSREQYNRMIGQYKPWHAFTVNIDKPTIEEVNHYPLRKRGRPKKV